MTHKVSNYDCNHNLCNTVENLNGFSRLSHVICTHTHTLYTASSTSTDSRHRSHRIAHLGINTQTTTRARRHIQTLHIIRRLTRSYGYSWFFPLHVLVTVSTMAFLHALVLYVLLAHSHRYAHEQHISSFGRCVVTLHCTA